MEHKNVSSLFTIHSRAIHDHSRSVADKKIILNYCNYVNLFLKSTCSSCYLFFNTKKKQKKGQLSTKSANLFIYNWLNYG